MVYLGPLADSRRPGWLPADEMAWRDLLAVLASDVDWFERQWALAGGRPPALDLSWVRLTTVRG